MVEFAINDYVHAVTQRTPFFVKWITHPRFTAILECNAWMRGVRDSLDQKPFWLLLITCRR